MTDQERLAELAQELKAVAQRYVYATGRTFDPAFTFTEVTGVDSSRPQYLVHVCVGTSLEATA